MSLLTPVLKSRGVLALLFLLFPTSVFAQHYVQTNLVSSPPGMGTNPTNPQDPDLINPGASREAQRVPGGSPTMEPGCRRFITGRAPRIQILLLLSPSQWVKVDLPNRPE